MTTLSNASTPGLPPVLDPSQFYGSASLWLFRRQRCAASDEKNSFVTADATLPIAIPVCLIVLLAPTRGPNVTSVRKKRCLLTDFSTKTHRWPKSKNKWTRASLINIPLKNPLPHLNSYRASRLYTAEVRKSCHWQ